jgi:hypothetical protein
MTLTPRALIFMTSGCIQQSSLPVTLFVSPGEAVERLGKVTRQRRQSRTTTLELRFGRPIGRIPSGSLMLSCSAD